MSFPPRQLGVSAQGRAENVHPCADRELAAVSIVLPFENRWKRAAVLGEKGSGPDSSTECLP